MSNDVLGYSSHDWRKNTDDAVVVADKSKMKVNESRRKWMKMDENQ